MTNNPLVARFDSTPSLVAAECQTLFQSCLHQAASVTAHIEARTREDAVAPQMADEFWFHPDDWRAQFRPYVVKDGVLHIPVKGVLLHNFPYAIGSWATGYHYIWKAFERGLSDGSVKGIALLIDSPGGEVAGNFDLVDKMFAARGTKSVRAYASESAYSAAYSIASVADTITVSRTGGVGSIGVVTAHVDYSQAMAKEGVKLTFIHAGKHKVDGNPYEPLKPEVKERIKTRIDELYAVFVLTVARNRGMNEEKVRDTEALTFTATQAVSIGLADEIGSFEDAVAAFAADLSLNDEDEQMSEKEKTAAVQAASTEALDAARAEGFAAGKAEGKAEGVKEGAAAERTRINAILGSEEGKKRPKAALSAALKTEMSAEAADAFLADLDEEKAVTPAASKGKTGAAQDFATAMNNAEHPELGAPDASEGEKQSSRAERAATLAFGQRKSA